MAGTCCWICLGFKLKRKSSSCEVHCILHQSSISCTLEVPTFLIFPPHSFPCFWNTARYLHCTVLAPQFRAAATQLSGHRLFITPFRMVSIKHRFDRAACCCSQKKPACHTQLHVAVLIVETQIAIARYAIAMSTSLTYCLLIC